MGDTRAVLVGELAARELGRVDFEARVVGATSRAIYLESREGEVLWISPQDSAPHRRAILAPLEGLRWREGQRCGSETNGCIASVGSQLIWGDAPIWSPSPMLGGDLGRPSVRRVFGDALRIVSQRHDVQGIATLWALQNGRTSPEPTGMCWLMPGRRAVVDAVEAGRTADAVRLLRAADALVGLGQGLTPSGDDFLGGLLFLRWHRARLAETTDPAEGAIDAWLDGARERTSAISHAILADMAHGQGPGPLHELVGALAGGAPVDLVAQCAHNVARIGHSSGWDLLAGVAAGLGISPGTG